MNSDSAVSQTKTLSWDIEDRLLSASVTGFTPGSYGYNGLGARVHKQVGSSVKNYLRDGAYVLAPVLHDGTSGFTPGVGMSTSGATRSFAADRLGTHSNEVSSTGVAATREYDAFGNLLDPPRQGASPFGYVGDWGYSEDDETGLKQVGFREYDPNAGRFLTPDMSKEGSNWFAYCRSDPVNLLDPSGLVIIAVIWYEVAKVGHHAGLVVIDNEKGGKDPIYSFAGGPENYGTIWAGKLVSHSGPWRRGTQDYNMTGGKWKRNAMVLVNDRSPAKPWISKFDAAERAMKAKATPRYDLLGGGPNGANSNSWTRELLQRTGLLDAYNKAEKKRHGAPWSPGWETDVWP